jgi:hypothetical protein
MLSRRWLAASCILLGLTLHVSDGHFSAAGITGLFLTCAAVAMSFLAQPDVDDRAVERVLGVGLLLQFGALLSRPIGIYLQGGEAVLAIAPTAIGLMAVLVGTTLARRPLAKRATVPLILGLFALCCIATLVASPEPRIDVFLFHRAAIRALLHGQNPYAVEIPNIYGHTAFFGPGVADGQVVHAGFPYPPASLFLSTAGQLLTGDARSAQALALVLTAVLLLRAGGSQALLAALLFLSTPRIFFVLEQSWTEPFLVLLLTACVVTARRKPRLLPLTLGLLFALKQYTVLIVPLVPLLFGRPFAWGKSLRVLLPAFGVALVLTLPLVLWDPAAFFHSALWMQFNQPFRPDSLSFTALWTAAGQPPPPVTPLVLVATLAAVVLALRRAPATPAGFGAATGLVFLTFFAFNKQAFCAYYFFVLGAFICALGAAHPLAENAEANSREAARRGGAAA